MTGRAGLLGLRWFLTFPSSALDRNLLLSLDLLGLFVVLVGRRKDAERDSGEALVDVSGGGVGVVVVVVKRDLRNVVLGPGRAHMSLTLAFLLLLPLLSLLLCAINGGRAGRLTGFWRRNPAWRL